MNLNPQTINIHVMMDASKLQKLLICPGPKLPSPTNAAKEGGSMTSTYGFQAKVKIWVA